jgi:phosphatidylglycerophosphatase A
MRISKPGISVMESHDLMANKPPGIKFNIAWKAFLTVGGLGYSPLAPGTVGALGALLPAILLIKLVGNADLWLLFLVILVSVLGIIGSNIAEKEWGKDPSKIVIDEAAGIWISLLFTGTSWFFIISAFVLFRFFDIFKPLGIRQAERLPGGTGVMADDILAGVYTNIVLQGLLYFVPELRY